jgi:tetratricopeptide (TPR) repeat protein
MMPPTLPYAAVPRKRFLAGGERCLRTSSFPLIHGIMCRTQRRPPAAPPTGVGSVPMVNRRHAYIAAALVALAAVLVFLPSVRNGFVNWDDDVVITDNLRIRSLDSAFLRWAVRDVSLAGYWHPITWVSHAVDYAVWGPDPAGHHATNVLLHGINTALVLLLTIVLLEAGRNEGTPFLRGDQPVLIAAVTAAVLFGLHPLRVESVAWISQRKDLLSALFFLASLLAYALHVRSRGGTRPSVTETIGSRAYRWSLILFLCALASKPMAVTLPVVLLLLDGYPFRRFRGGRDAVAVLAEKAPFFALSIIVSAVTVAAQRSIGFLPALGTVPVLTRALTACRSVLAYLAKTVMPTGLSPFYPHPASVTPASAEYLLPVVIVAGITAGCIAVARRQPWWLAAWGCFLIVLLPVLGLVQVSLVSMADRYTYLPGIALVVPAGLAAARVGTRLDHAAPSFRRTAAALAILACACLSVLTVRQIGVWKDGVTLWTAVAERWGDRAPIAFSNRATAFARRGAFDRAVVDYTKAISLTPGNAGLYDNRAIAYKGLGMLDRAVEDHATAIGLRPGHAPSYVGRALAYQEMGRNDASLRDFDRAIELEPSYADAYTGRGWLSMSTGNVERAMADYDRALTLDPLNPIAANDRGLGFQAQGRPDRAIEDFTAAIRLNPAFAEAYTNRGMAFEQMGDDERALRDYTAAISADPSFAAAYTDRGLLQVRHGRPEDGLADLDRAIALDPGGFAAYINRGLAQEDLGRLEAALADHTRAVELQPENPAGYSNRGIVLMKLGRFSEAVRDHTAALERDRTFSRAYLDRGDCERKMGNEDLARKDYREACVRGITQGCEALEQGRAGTGDGLP